MATAGIHLCTVLALLGLLIHTVEARDEYTAEKWFYRTHSGLTDVPDDIPKESEGIYLNNNYIRNLTKGSFSKNSAVTFMSLSDNKIIDIETGAFLGLTSIREIWLGRNQLTVLKRNMFYGLENLESLVLSDNSINVTEAGCFNGLSKLINLFLYGNQFVKLKAKMFSGLDSLQKMILTHNHISVIEVGTFTGLGNLLELWIDHNNEKLSDLSNNTFLGLVSIEILYIHDNEIATIESGLFNGLTKLRDLGLDDNVISQIKPGAFKDLESLSKLWLYNNKLTTLDSSIFPGLPRDVELTLGFNPLQCDSRLCWLRRLERDGYLTWIELEDRKLEPDCKNGEDWKELNLNCSAEVECGDPGGVDHAVRTGGVWPYHQGAEFSYRCNACYTGGGAITCQSNGTWTKKPTCEVLMCSVIGSNTNGTQAKNAYTCGTVITCSAGYQVEGNAVITCSEDGKVKGTQPYCREIVTTPKPQTTTVKSNSTPEYSPVTKTKNDQLELILIVLILSLLCLIILVVVIVFCLKRRGACCCCAGGGGAGGRVKDGTVVYPSPGEMGCRAGEEAGVAGVGTPSPRGSLGPEPFIDVCDTKQILERSESADSEL